MRTALIRRCLRYASHGPWGSLWAEANGERDAYQRIIEQLWPDPQAERRQFAAGAGVTVIPVTILPWKKNVIRFRPKEKEQEVEGWLFAREAHYQRPGSKPETRGIEDITDEIV